MNRSRKHRSQWPISAEFRRRLLQEVEKDIDRLGCHITSVSPTDVWRDPSDPYWLYTTGLLKTYRHPELMLFAPEPEPVQALLEAIISQIAKGVVYADGQRVSGLLPNQRDVYFRAAPAEDAEYPCTTSAYFYGHTDFAVLQVVLPDKSNRMPWEEGVEPTMTARQQLLVRE